MLSQYTQSQLYEIVTHFKMTCDDKTRFKLLDKKVKLRDMKEYYDLKHELFLTLHDRGYYKILDKFRNTDPSIDISLIRKGGTVWVDDI